MGGEDRTGHGSARVQASSAERQADGFLVGVCVGKLEGYFRLADLPVVGEQQVSYQLNNKKGNAIENVGFVRRQTRVSTPNADMVRWAKRGENGCSWR